jgi:hypothetical protein
MNTEWKTGKPQRDEYGYLLTRTSWEDLSPDDKENLKQAIDLALGKMRDDYSPFLSHISGTLIETFIPCKETPNERNKRLKRARTLHD